MSRPKVERVSMSCPVCGTITERLPSQTRGGYCSKACVTESQRGVRRPDYTDKPYWTVLENGCWEWNNGTRYGKIKFHGKDVAAHVWMYERTFGPVPEGHHVHHTCEYPRCVNPEHLTLETTTSHSRLHKAILTPEQVKLIKASSDRTSVLARHFGVAPSTICDIRHGRTWVDVRP